MRSLLLGGSGFIGSALAREMIRRGETVVSVSLNGEGDAPGVTPVALNLYEKPCPQHLLDEADCVFILVGQVHGAFDAEQEKELITRLAQGLKQSKARVFYASTVHVYGETPAPATEDSPRKPLDAYGQFKVEAEAILGEYIPTKRLTIMRFTNIYGSPKNRGIIGLVMRKLMETEGVIEITLNGGGVMRKDYLLLDDLVQAILVVRDTPQEHGIVNLGTGTSYTLLELIDMIEKVSKRTIKRTINETKPTNEPMTCLMDTTRLREVYGFTTFTSLEEGLATTLKRYKEH